ncbi:P1 family peptidase [Corynebacterium sp. LaCa54]|uniref:P1 family peptidase n=1 Tax=Corynebacterium TaxID=1716 RepID=UPI0020053E20|nr:P1 family peptidase [Corynebacterium kefirresidentii]MCK6082951.1 P1 family peptidase [Corynebacterium kefirresidentii]
MLDGINIGHYSGTDTGVTVLYCGPGGALGSVDVRGGGPGTRETDLLQPHNTVERVHAVVLSGGSAFGLAAADGVMNELAEQGIGFPVFGEEKPGPRVPIVPGAVIFDLLVGPSRPGPEEGAAALRAALAGNDETMGTVGAGVGATAGKLRGGFGLATRRVGQYEVSAAMVANPVGEVIDPQSGRLYGAPGSTAVNAAAYRALPHPAESKLNTTIGAVLTDAPINTAQAQRLAMTAHDGIARAVRPAHSPLDGDTIFALSTAQHPAADPGALAMTPLCAAAADAVEEAIVNAVTAAEPGLGLSVYRDLLD